ncbi:MAG: phospholipase D family protein [Clostridiales bacterium]|nr:phospholipase D family protein [Clostridiales bacterium]
MIIIKKTCKILIKLLILWMIFVVLASTVAAGMHKPISSQEKEKNSLKNLYQVEEEIGPDRAEAIITPVDALGVRLRMVQGAQQQLDIVYHTIREGGASYAFLWEVIQAAQRGVQVRVIIDSVANITSGKKVWKILEAMNRHPNIQVMEYSRFHLLKPWQWHMLLHDKFIIADNRLLLLGGRNIDQRHFAPYGFEKAITYDTDLFLWKHEEEKEGNSSGVTQVAAYMEELWHSGYCSPLKKETNKKQVEKQYQFLHQEEKKFQQENPLFYKQTLTDYLDRTVETSRVTLLSNPIENRKKNPLLWYQIQQVLAKAEKKVQIQTPYSTGNKELLHTLKETAKRIPVEIVTNSLRSTPNLVAYSNYFGHREKFLQTGAKLYEYQSDNSNHGKSLVVDDRLVLIGSFNMDDRSMYLSTETMVAVDSIPLAEKMAKHIEDIKKESFLVGEDNQYVLHEGEEWVPPSMIKTISGKVVFWLMRLFQFLL